MSLNSQLLMVVYLSTSVICDFFSFSLSIFNFFLDFPFLFFFKSNATLGRYHTCMGEEKHVISVSQMNKTDIR